MNRSICLIVVSLFGVGLTSSALAQDILEQLYGSGVHAYFAGNNQRAEEHLNDVINAGGQDPRVYYFRGLTQIQTQGGMVNAGLADFERAAELEVTGKRSSDVSKALTRIQGPTRIAIERIRAKAKLTAKSLQFEMMRDRFEQPGTAAAPPLSRNGLPPSIPNAVPNATEPFTDGSGLTGGQPTPMPVPNDAPASNPLSPFDNTTPPPDATMPLPDATTPVPGPANPFGDDPPAAPTTPSPDANPFG